MFEFERYLIFIFGAIVGSALTSTIQYIIMALYERKKR